MKYLLPTLFILITCYLLLFTFPTPSNAQDACIEGCVESLAQCENDGCSGRQPGGDRDNCINDCSQAHGRCQDRCNGGDGGGGACRAITPVQLVSAEPSNQGSAGGGYDVVFRFRQGEDPDPLNGGCDGTGRNYTVSWGTCPAGTTNYNSTCSAPIGQTSLSNRSQSGPEYQTNASIPSGTYYWYVHSQCNCGTAVDSEKTIFINTCGSKEELAVYNQKGGLTPDIFRTPQELNILEQLVTNVRNFFAGLFFPPPPCDNAKLYNFSNDLSQITVPEELIPKGDDIKENLKGFLGKNDGHYCVDFPEELKGDAIKDCEVAYEPANFPSCIYPITPGAKPTSDGSCPLTPLGPSTNTQPSSNNNSCIQACVATLDQCQKNNCTNSTPGRDQDNCLNECAIAHGKCQDQCRAN